MLNICMQCGIELTTKQQKSFCSRSCAATYNNQHRPDRRRGICKKCGEPCRSGLRYCSDACRPVRTRAIRNWSTFSEERKKKNVLSVAAWRQRKKARAVAYKGGACQICGYNKSLVALHFHHRDPSKKDFIISRASKSWEAVLAELDKCDLLCANCHAETHDRIR